MSKEELIEFLKENLKVNLSTDRACNGYYVNVEILLGKETISESSVLLCD